MKNLLLVIMFSICTSVQAQRILGPYWVSVDTEHGNTHDVEYYLIEDSSRLFLGFIGAKKDVHCVVKTTKGSSERVFIFPLGVDDQQIVNTKGFTVTSITCQEDVVI